MIERPNQAVLNEALNEFRDAMRPFIARGMRRIKGKTIVNAIYDSLSSKQANQFKMNLQNNGRSIEGAIDIGDFPNLISRNWGLFSPQFRGDMNVQSLLHIITQARNKALHPPDEDLDTEYTRVVLYHIVDILDKINASEAKARVESKRDKLFEDIYPKPLKPEPPEDTTHTPRTIAERYVAGTTEADRDEVARKVVELRINATGSRPLAWRKIRERLGLHNDHFHKVIRVSDGYRKAVIDRIKSLRAQEGGWEYSGNLERLTGIELTEEELS